MSTNQIPNLLKTQLYPDEAIIFIVFTYRQIALCHTAYTSLAARVMSGISQVDSLKIEL
jgi:dihydroxyacid dehydratase/phosphogluconate dehydratase